MAGGARRKIRFSATCPQICGLKVRGLPHADRVFGFPGRMFFFILYIFSPLLRGVGACLQGKPQSGKHAVESITDADEKVSTTAAVHEPRTATATVVRRTQPKVAVALITTIC